MSEKESEELNLQATRLLKSVGILPREFNVDVYGVIRKKNYVGYSHYYLQKSYDESELLNKADITIYKQLLEIDAKFGTKQAEQLHGCVFDLHRMDLIKVWIYFLVFELKIF